MSRLTISTVSLAICATVTSQAIAETKNIDIPLIPVTDVQQPVKKKQAKPADLKPVTIQMRPGINEIVAISMGHLNRIVTPFNEPKVVTVSGAAIQKEDNVVYVSTETNSPVTLFVTQADSESQALSLTLVPKRIPPQEIFLNMGMADMHAMGISASGRMPSAGASGLTGYGYTHAIKNKKAERWERKNGYVETIKKVMVNLAKGEVPTGYTMSALASVGTLPAPVCQQQGLEFDWTNAQALFGHRLNATVGVVKNVSGQDIELLPNPCFEVAAFSSWPEVYLRPGDQTEVYVVRRQNEIERVVSKRPSLLSY